MDAKKKKRVHFTLLYILYGVITFLAMAIWRFKDGYLYVKPYVFYPWVYYPLFVGCSLAFLWLVFRKGIPLGARKAFIMAYAVTTSTMLILYKVPIALMDYLGDSDLFVAIVYGVFLWPFEIFSWICQMMG